MKPNEVSEQCQRCTRLVTRGGYLALPARAHCDAMEGESKASEAIAHLMMVAAFKHDCPFFEDVGQLADAYKSADAPFPIA